MECRPQKLIPELVRGFKTDVKIWTYTDRDSMLYALSIGFSQDQLNRSHLNYTYENSEQFSTFPTFATVCKIKDFDAAYKLCPGLPDFDNMMVIGVEQKIEVYKPLPTSGTVKNQATIIDVADKGKYALVTMETLVTSEDGEVYNKCTLKHLIRGIGGFGDKGVLKEENISKIPQRKPDLIAFSKTERNQSLLFRLCCDRNPFHVDPIMSVKGGFETPILFGLCTIGFTARIVIENLCGGDSTRFKEMKVRYTSHVFPGETLVVEMWKEGNHIILATKTHERGLVVLIGYIDLLPDKI